MSELIEKLVRLKAPSQTKSYFIGLERGRIWAMDIADYFELKEWNGVGGGDPAMIALPVDEEQHYHTLTAESDIEWAQYVKGWLDGVKEASGK
jgi:hypothetical protein